MVINDNYLAFGFNRSVELYQPQYGFTTIRIWRNRLLLIQQAFVDNNRLTVRDKLME